MSNNDDRDIEMIDVDKAAEETGRKVKGQGPYPAGNVTRGTARRSAARSSVSSDGIVGIIQEHLILVAALAVAVILFLVLGISSCAGGSASGDASGNAAESSDYTFTTFEVNAHEDINDLMETYYTAYAEGDLTALQTVATPISTLEQSYITMMSSYLESYEVINVYTEQGLDENSYLVAVETAMHFDGVETAAPGIETFYVRKNDEGSYYIDNVYSWFNLSGQENTIDQTIADRITEYKQEADGVYLFAKVDGEYDTALASDADLNTMMTKTIPAALSQWVYSSTADSVTTNETTESTDGTDTTTEETTTEETTTEETTTEETTTEETTTEETTTEESTTESTTTTTTSSKPTVNDDFEKGTEIYCVETVVVRSKMKKKSDRVATVYGGEWLTVVESYDNGWTKVKYGKKKGYVKTSVLQDQSW
ncbi:MAG: hypothetical protein K5840_07890 [Eubacterium sp.]|nr:hypothetical protein [Eubacterium sp.]